MKKSKSKQSIRPNPAKLPDNCEIEFFEDEGTFRLVFQGEGEPYISEIYGISRDETLSEAALAVCRRFGWIDNPPG